MYSQYPDPGDRGAKPAPSLADQFADYLLRSFRWVVTTNWFLFLLAALLVGGSLLISFHTDAWHWFQRSGALLVSIGAILSTRRPLCIILEGMIVGQDIDTPADTAGENLLSNPSELQACVCGFAFVAMGTMIWAYGDLLGCLLPWSSSCLI